MASDFTSLWSVASKGDFAELTRVLKTGKLSDADTAAILTRLSIKASEEQLLPLAYELATRATQADGSLTRAQAERGLVALKLGKASVAYRSFQQLLNLQSPSAEILFHLGLCCEVQQRWHEAAEFFTRAAELEQPASAVTRFKIASALIQAGNAKQALDYLSPTMANTPAISDELIAASACMALGDFQQSRQHCQHILKKQSDHAEALRLLSMSKSFSNDNDDDLKLITEALQNSDLPVAQREVIQISYAKILRDLGDTEQAFDQLKKAKDSQWQRGIRFDRPEHRKLVNAVCRFDYQSLPNVSVKSSIKPVFIIGLPRSGTTLLETLLAKRAKISSAGEQGYFFQLAFDVLQPYPDSLLTGSQQELEDIANSYLQVLANYDSTQTFVTDKFPGNFLFVGLLSVLFPNAHFLQISRDPVATGWSIYQQHFGTSNPYHTRLPDIAACINDYVFATKHWSTLLKGRWTEVAYENLVTEPDHELTRIVSRLGLSIRSPADSEARSGTVATLSSWQVRQPLHQRSIDHWQEYRSCLGPLIDNLEV